MQVHPPWRSRSVHGWQVDLSACVKRFSTKLLQHQCTQKVISRVPDLRVRSTLPRAPDITRRKPYLGFNQESPYQPPAPPLRETAVGELEIRIAGVLPGGSEVDRLPHTTHLAAQEAGVMGPRSYWSVRLVKWFKHRMLSISTRTQHTEQPYCWGHCWHGFERSIKLLPTMKHILERSLPGASKCEGLQPQI